VTSSPLAPVFQAYHAARSTWSVRVTRDDVLDAVREACQTIASGWTLSVDHGAEDGDDSYLIDGDEAVALVIRPALSDEESTLLSQFTALVASDLELVRLRTTSRTALRQSQKVARQLHQIIATALNSASADTASGVLVTLARATRSLFDGDESWAVICEGPFAPLAVRCVRGQPPQRLTLDDDDVTSWRSRIPTDGPVVDATSVAAALRDDAGGTYGLVWVTRPVTDVDVEGELVSLVAQIATSSLTAMTLQHSITASEQRLRVVIDTAPVGIIESDASGQIVWANPRARALLGIDGDTDWPATIRSLVHDVWRSPDGGSVELPPVTLHGRVMVLTAAAAPLAPTGGTLTVLDDVTDQRAMKEEMRQANRMEIRGQVASAIAHDFNNLLTLISGYVDLLGSHVANDSAAAGLLASIATTATRAAGLTAQLQSVGRTASATMAPVDLNAALSANAEVLERVLGGAITVVWELTDANATTRTDADLFEQMVLNLSTNARDAMGGAGTLTFATDIVTREHEERVTDFVRVRISDTGSGMDDETMAKCFEPLFTTKGPLKGTGMGLAGARRLVEESRGFVEVTSQLGRGTTFSFFFPVSREEAATATPPLVHTEAVIAVVDDDVALRQMMVHLLRRYGYEVREYGNPLDVAADPTIGEVALVVSDVMMPELTGVELARDLGERFPDVALLLVSGTADHDVLDGLKPGVTLLAKPFRPSALVDAVHHQLAQRAARR